MIYLCGMNRYALISRDEPGVTYLGSAVSEVKEKLLKEHEGYTDRYCALLTTFCDKHHDTVDDLAEEWNADDDLNTNGSRLCDGGVSRLKCSTHN